MGYLCGQLSAVPWKFSEGGLESPFHLFVDNSWEIFVDDSFLLILVLPLVALYCAVTVKQLNCVSGPFGVDAWNRCEDIQCGDSQMDPFEQFSVLIELVAERGEQLLLGEQCESLLWISEDNAEG